MRCDAMRQDKTRQDKATTHLGRLELSLRVGRKHVDRDDHGHVAAAELAHVVDVAREVGAAARDSAGVLAFCGLCAGTSAAVDLW